MTELDYYDLGDLIEERFDLGRTDANNDLCAQAMIGTAIDASYLVPIPLPPEALAALNSAERYLKGELSSNELTQVRIGLWTYLGNRSCDFDDPNVNAVRLVLCATFHTWEREHLLESLMAIHDFALAVGVHKDSLSTILRKRFEGLISDH